MGTDAVHVHIRRRSSCAALPFGRRTTAWSGRAHEPGPDDHARRASRLSSASATVKPAPFRYARPTSLADAVKLLADGQGDNKLIAGGQSLVPMLNMRLVRPSVLVDLNGVPGLDGIAPEHDGGVTLGALVRHADLVASPIVRARAPLLAEAARHVGHTAIRNRGTVGGSVAHADPAAELPAALMALRAELTLIGPRGERRVLASNFFVGSLATQLSGDEILTEIRVPAAAAGWGFAELARRPGDFALAGIAAVLWLEEDLAGRCAEALVVGFGVGDRPVRLGSTERLLGGERVDAEAIRAAAHLAGEACAPPTDVHASEEYRRHLANVLAERALLQALGRLEVARHRARRTTLAAPAAGVRTTTPGGDAIIERAVSSHHGDTDGLAATDRPAVRCTVNGEVIERTVEARRSLADFLREDLSLTGTHVGCEHGVCGACTVLVDGRSARSCLYLAAQLEAASVTTIEGLTPAAGPSPLQEAFRARHALQCGFCTPGMIVAATELLASHASPTQDDTREALAGNLCMCTGYVNIVRAVEDAARVGSATSTPDLVGGSSRRTGDAEMPPARAGS
jgi:CO/xanthine dehydrogenase FAD-binding subunit/aerobic-type carbon monoxide dehydrogenase small subunit (CoxS/CutS family)